MKVCVIGSGGREHALCHTFHRQGHVVYCLPGNAGTDTICESKEVNPRNFPQLLDFVKSHAIDLTVVGPEEYLDKGIADFFAEKGLTLFGPTKSGSRLESSKAFAKRFMTKYQIPTARFQICKSIEEARMFVDYCFDRWKGIVIKPSGLTNGKGVTCCDTKEEALAAVDLLMEAKQYGDAGSAIVLEEKLVGQEISLLALCDGKQIVPLIPSQDHKRLCDGDDGPNTGGMGAYAPVQFDIPDSGPIVTRTLQGLLQESIDYRGVIYFGLMLTNEGPKVLEYNCRFGDPETQALLPLLESDLAEWMLACSKGALPSAFLQWSSKSSCCVVMASEGYPSSYTTGKPISGLDKAQALVFHAGTKKDDKGQIVSAGGRVLGVTGLGNSLQEAVDNAYKSVEAITFAGAHFRHDIASQGLIHA